LEEFINGKARIVPYWVNGGLDGPIDADLVILSSDLVRNDLIECGLLPDSNAIRDTFEISARKEFFRLDPCELEKMGNNSQ